MEAMKSVNFVHLSILNAPKHSLNNYLLINKLLKA